MPKPGEMNPPTMPQGPQWVMSKDFAWGSPKISKVVKCSDIPSKFRYNTQELYYCDHMPSPTAKMSSVDEAYAAWRALDGLWPPTKPCEDDLEALTQTLRKIAPPLAGSNCSVAYARLQQFLPNFDCDNSDLQPTIRDMCCSVCGGHPIPDVPSPSPPGPVQYQCRVCNHVYDAQRDGNGTAFEDLPDSWVCPVCGAPKSAYQQQATGEWVHVEPL